MTGDFSLLSSLTKKDGGHVMFGDNSQEKILGFKNIGNSLSPSIDNVQLVDNLKHNLLSISQLCDKSYRIVFDSFSFKLKMLHQIESCLWVAEMIMSKPY